MINNSTNNTSNTTTGIVINGGEVYLKKSELPKTISAFKNDVGYISKATLEDWMGEHSYIPMDEIKELIKKANIQVVDGIKQKTDSEAIERLDNLIKNIKGEIVELKDKLENQYVEKKTLKEYIKISDFPKKDSIALKTDIPNIPSKVSDLENDKGYLTEHQDLTKYVTKDEIPSLEGYAKVSDIPSLEGYAKTTDIPSITDLAKKSDIPSLEGYAKVSDIPSLEGYAKKDEIPTIADFITKNEVVEKIDEVSKKIPSMDGLATESWVEGKGYLTEHQSLTGLATESWVEGKGYLTEHQSLADYAKKSVLESSLKQINNNLTNYTTKDEISKTYMSKEDILKKFISKQDVAREYLSIEDYRGLKDASVINDVYRDKPYSKFLEDLPTLKNGFYIVDGDNAVIVKDHEIITMFKDGVVQPVLQWHIEED